MIMPSWHGRLRSVLDRRFRRYRLTPETKVIALRQQLDRLSQHRRYKGPADIAPVSIGGMPAEWIKPPKADSQRVVLYFHGGGYCLGSREIYRPMVAQLCTAAEARGLLIDYRLAPEHPFPAALDDAVSAYRWLLGQGIGPSGIVLAGDAAGGGLAIATAMALRDGGAPLPRAIVTLSPWADLAFTGLSMLTNAKRDTVLQWETLALCARHYLRKTLPTNPFASPLYGNFKGLPPLLIHAGSEELLKDDATRIAEKAEAAGCDVSCEIWDGMPHAFQYFCDLKEAAGSLDRIGSFIRSRVAATPAGSPAPKPTVSPFRRRDTHAASAAR
jgi:epsilon-lactone hydrolase